MRRKIQEVLDVKFYQNLLAFPGFCMLNRSFPSVFQFRFQKMSPKSIQIPKNKTSVPSSQVRNIKCLVLDEADRLLDMGFEPQMRSIHKKLLEAAKVPSKNGAFHGEKRGHHHGRFSWEHIMYIETQLCNWKNR